MFFLVRSNVELMLWRWFGPASWIEVSLSRNELIHAMQSADSSGILGCLSLEVLAMEWGDSAQLRSQQGGTIW